MSQDNDLYFVTPPLPQINVSIYAIGKHSDPSFILWQARRRLESGEWGDWYTVTDPQEVNKILLEALEEPRG